MAEDIEAHVPEVSVVVVVYNMIRAAPRTLLSLSAAYQRDIAAADYEVIVVDNGSTPPFDPGILDGLEGNFRLIRMERPHPSPAQAVNRGLAEARGQIIGVMIDGARMVTPGLLHFARHGVRLYRRAVVATLTWHLGFDAQRFSAAAGYDEAREDALLQSIAWPEDGYRLFEIAALVGSSIDGWLQPLSESNAVFLSGETWKLLGGVDERFVEPAGGFVNLDLFHRAIDLPDARLVILLGEGTFHQLHGRLGTQPGNLHEGFASERMARFATEYQSIRGEPWTDPVETAPRTYLGTLPRPVLARLTRAALEPVRVKLGDREPPLGRSFDRSLWSLTPMRRPDDPATAALVDIIHQEFRAGRYEAAAAVARLARRHAPDEPEPQRILAQAGVWLPANPPAAHRAEIHHALGQAWRALGDFEKAMAEYRAALDLDGNLMRSRIGLAQLQLPGPLYASWLDRLHAALKPETYVEIGVAAGATLSLARPPTLAIGIDPAPRPNASFRTETHIIADTSDAAFAQNKIAPLLQGRPLGLAFIDGLHLFEYALRDFMHLESYCGARSVILLHDTIPQDELTQRRERQTGFYCGDVWKTVLCLKQYRRDLDIFTIATPWTGLTVVTHLDATSNVLQSRYDEIVAGFMNVPYASLDHDMAGQLNIVANDWDTVASRLRRGRILNDDEGAVG